MASDDPALRAIAKARKWHEMSMAEKCDAVDPDGTRNLLGEFYEWAWSAGTTKAVMNAVDTFMEFKHLQAQLDRQNGGG